MCMNLSGVWSLVMAVLVAFGPTMKREHANYEYISELIHALPPAVRCDGDSQVTPTLLLAIAYTESRLQIDAQGRILRNWRAACEAGTSKLCPRPLGIMQVVPSVRLPWGAAQLMTPDGGFAAASWMLKMLRADFGDEFLCRYGGARGVCAETYARKVRSAHHRLELALWHIETSDRCLNIADASRLAFGCQVCGQVDAVDCR